jgi:hypothetical protein
MGIWKCAYSQINSTFKYKDPRIAWIGNPHQQNCMVEAGTKSLLTKVHPEKKTQSEKTRRCPIGNLIPYQTPSSFFRPPDFLLWCTFTGKILLSNFVKATVLIQLY